MASKSSAGPFSLIERDWGGMNSDSPRQAMAPGEFAWLENLIPIASGDLAVVPGKTSVASVSAETINAFSSTTVSGQPYVVGATSNGNVYAWTVPGYTKKTVGSSHATSGITFTSFQNQYLLVLDPTNGLYYWDGTTQTHLSSPPWSGTPQAIAYWAGRVWVAVGLTVFYSAPNSVTDWTTASGGGSFIVSDEYLEGQVVSLVPSQDYLYVVGVGAVLMLSNLQLLSGNVTYFQVTRVTQTNGTYSEPGAETYEDGMVLVNSHGLYSFTGVTVTKLSQNMNVFFSNVDFTKTLSVGVATVYNKTVLMALVYYTPNTAWYLACFFENKWFLCNFGTLSLVTWITLNQIIAGFVTDGTTIYELFTDTTTGIAFKAVSAFNDGGDPTAFKELLKVGVEVNIPSTSGMSVSFTSDTETSSNPSQTFTLATGYNWLRQQTSQFGQYLGLTITGTLAGAVIQGAMAQFKRSVSWP